AAASTAAKTGARHERAGGRGHRRRAGVGRAAPQGVLVGGSTVATLLAQRIAPALLDRYLARGGFASQ
ncbi:hypothetical protein, partial [Actinomadura roseirufa]|uniref:hypothetical protein n=1 Tax=Actinomadura roseirufa TaxID=2094049 RepID=UPI0035207568